jgi:UDP-glucose 4,6-dehydratase
VDTIVHFAAQTHVDASFESAFAFTETNVLGTHKLLHAASSSPSVKRFIHMSTDEVYGETTDHSSGVTEDVFLQPTNPYAASKVGAEALVCAYQKSYGLNAVIIRANNVYGPGQYPEKLIPRFLLRHQLGLPLQVQGSGHQTRHFLYLSDAIRAICTVVSRGLSGNIYNIASKDEVSVLDVANKIGGSTSSVVHVSDRKFNDQRYWVDDKKLRSLGWKQETSLENGLKVTCEWYGSTELTSYWPLYRKALHDLD